MARVTGIGGIFFKANNPETLAAWYKQRLGIEMYEPGQAMFHWRHADQPDRNGSTIWALFPADTDYFSPGAQPFMVNYRVDDLDAMLASLRAEGMQVDERIEEHEYGRFGWVMDPEGNRIELWEPPEGE